MPGRVEEQLMVLPTIDSEKFVCVCVHTYIHIRICVYIYIQETKNYGGKNANYE